MSKTKIEWTQATVNPWVGCTKVSPSCQNCYAERMAKRLKAMGLPQYQDVVDENGWTGKLRTNVKAMEQLITGGGKPKRIFLGSMTDIFHEAIPDNAIRTLFQAIAANNGSNIYQVLTKRIDRAFELFGNGTMFLGPKFWLGVTVCNQPEADAKIPILLQIPAAVRFVSVEPMLGPVDLINLQRPEIFHQSPYGWHNWLPGHLHQVICGAETGPGARPMEPDWARSLKDQCVDYDIAFFFKKDSDGNRLLDGKLWEQYPERSES